MNGAHKKHLEYKLYLVFSVRTNALVWRDSSKSFTFKNVFRYCITRLDNWKFAELGPVHYVSCAWNADAVYWMVGLWSRNLSNGWVTCLASTNGSFFSRLHDGQRIMLLGLSFVGAFGQQQLAAHGILMQFSSFVYMVSILSATSPNIAFPIL